MHIRRLLQCSLRFFLIAFVALGIGIGSYLNGVRTQREAVDAIVEVGGTIVYGSEPATDSHEVEVTKKSDHFWLDFHEPVTDVDLSGYQIDDDICCKLARLPKLTGVSLSGTGVTDQGVDRLTSLKHLSFLDVSSTRISDLSLKHIAEIKSLQWVDLFDTRITDQGLSHLTSLQRLEWLGLGSTGITDAGLEHVAQIKTLMELDLSGNAVTNDGIRVLAGLLKLEGLDLRGTRVSKAGAENLRECLPNCKIQYTPVGNPGYEGYLQLGEDGVPLEFPAPAD